MNMIGLDNLELLYSSLVDFSELFIHTDEPLGVGQNETMVFKADYHGRQVAVKRIKCEVLTVGISLIYLSMFLSRQPSLTRI